MLLVRRPKGGRGFMMSKGFQFDPTCRYLLFSSSGCSCCSFCLILFCFWPIFLAYFSLNLHFPKGRLFCVVLLKKIVFERSGDKYFSWWCVQHMLPYGTIYSIFNFRLFLSILFSFFIIWYWNARPKWSIVPVSPNFICHFLWEIYRKD